MTGDRAEYPLAEAWWAATRERRLLVQQCVVCGARQHYPRVLCTTCGATDLDWLEASGRGTIYSFTEVVQAPPPHEAPYVIILVRLVEGPVMLSRLVGENASRPRCELPVQLAWVALEDGRARPVFEARNGDDGSASRA